MAGAPIGNQNARKENRIFGDELRKAIAQDNRKRIRDGIEKLLDKVAAGDLEAFKTVADRTDGKPVQANEISGPEGGPVEVKAQPWNLQPVKPVTKGKGKGNDERPAGRKRSGR